MMKNIFLLVTAIFTTVVISIAQETSQVQQNQLPLEVEDDTYVYVDRAKMPKSASYKSAAPNYFTKQVNVDAVGNNILNDAANEPSLAIDPTNPNRIVIGWRQFDNISNNFRQAGYGYSTNGGYDWTFPGVLEPGVFRSDPVLDFDNQGNFYYNSLQSGFECDVFAIRDGGQVWGPPVPANGGDKQWMRIDRTGGPSAGHNYSYWNNSFTTCPGDFTRSTDDAMSFEACESIPGSPFWGTLAVDADANLYLTGTTGGNIVVIKSTDADDAGSSVTFDNTSIVDLDGNLGVQDPINPQGLLGQAWVDVDVSSGAGRDNVYVVASINRSSNSDPADVMFAKSTDGGATFSAPVRINTDTGTAAYQWFGTMSVAPNGRIDIIWLDTRDAASGSFDSVLYYSFSEDQGTTWSSNEPISEPFDPTIGYPVQQKMGDYFDMKSDDDFAHIAWCGTFTGGQDVYYTKISPDGTLGVIENAVLADSFSLVPNPAATEVNISFNALGNTQVRVYDLLGREITTLKNDNASGLQQITWNLSTNTRKRINAGMYFVTVTSEGKTATKKLLIQ